MAKKIKSDGDEYNRLRIIQEWILKGETSTDIVRNCSAQWSVSDSEAKDYLKKAFELFQEQVGTDQNKRIAFHVQARMKLYKKALESNEFKTCHDILTDLAKLEGFYLKQDPQPRGRITHKRTGLG